MAIDRGGHAVSSGPVPRQTKCSGAARCGVDLMRAGELAGRPAPPWHGARTPWRCSQELLPDPTHYQASPPVTSPFSRTALQPEAPSSNAVVLPCVSQIAALTGGATEFSLRRWRSCLWLRRSGLCLLSSVLCRLSSVFCPLSPSGYQRYSTPKSRETASTPEPPEYSVRSVADTRSAKRASRSSPASKRLAPSSNPVSR